MPIAKKMSPGGLEMERHMQSLELMVPGVPSPHGDYPHARQAGDLVFFSGVGPRFPRPQGGRPYPERFEHQCQRVIDNAQAAIHGVQAAAFRKLEPVDVELFLLDLQHRDFVIQAFRSQLWDVNLDFRQVTGLPGGIQIEAKVLACASPSSLTDPGRRRRQIEVVSTGPTEDDRPAPLGFREQFDLVFERLSAALRERGTGLESILDVTVFLRRLTTDWEEYNRLYQGRFPSPRPARTTLGVSGLPSNHHVVVRAVVGVSNGI